MSAAKYVQKFCKCARKGKIYFYYVKYLKYCLRKITNAYHCLVPQYENLHKFILKLMAIANVADFFLRKTPMHIHVCNKICKELCKCARKEKFISIFYSIWQYQFSFQTCFHQVRVPPLPPPDPCIYLYCYTTLSCSVLSHRELGGGEGEGRDTATRGRTYIRTTGYHHNTTKF